MSKIMLIDAAHAEETRVAVVDGARVDEFDFESRAVKQLRGNIYLAKVTRVEPSLQAAFIEYGGNRHGFLAFNEIHPDYYQIPHADRAALMRDLERDEPDENGHDDVSDEDHEDEADAEMERRKRRLLRRYKIQEVIKRRQIMLVQVVKEERGNKGAALTTYLSLAGRYCVLMPNTDRGGGISRKITSATDRKRLKSVVQSLATPQGMGLIVRTAGAKRTKAEIKRDYEYLMRLWETIRETTLKSIAPALIYEEEDLVKRAIRDLYDKDLDTIHVEGEEGYREAKDFMRMLMPSQSKKVVAHRDPVPLFVKYGVEDRLASIHSPVVPLRSGGYLVINQTEALVAIDVNSGRATRERNVEATALKTNMEAAEEAARQLRLRDLAGLIVIDFIDMDESKNNRAVEKKLKDCLAEDRARVQMGKISGFGLMEISRQRRRSGVLEGTTSVCPHCEGLGRLRSVESSALMALRALQIEAGTGGTSALTLRVCTKVGLYILNEKRSWLARLEESSGLAITVVVDDDLPMAEHSVERAPVADGEEPRVSFQPPPRREPPRYVEPAAPAAAVPDDVDEDEEELDEEDEDDAVAADSRPGSSDGRASSSSRRRRRRRRGGSDRRDEAPSVEARPAPATPPPAPTAVEDDDKGGSSSRRRRGRRGGRKPGEERPRDPYVWFRPRLDNREDPYAWTDPHAPRPAPASSAGDEGLGEDVGPAEVAEAPELIEPPVAEAAVAAEAPAELEREADTADVAVEPAPEAAPVKRPSRSRSRKPAAARTAPTETEAPAPANDLTAEPTAAVGTAPSDTSAEAQAPDTSTVAEGGSGEPTAEAPLSEPVETAAPTEPTADEAVVPAAEIAPAEPDPAEISAPPEQPKRGWWRKRG